MSALFDPSLHEPLVDVEWDEDSARARAARIVTEAEAAFDPTRLWPKHPRDVEAGDETRSRGFTSLYLGAAGASWALWRLTGRSPLAAPELLDAFDAEPDMAAMRHGLLLGDAGVTLVAMETGEDGPAAYVDRLEAAIRDAIPRPERELMWAAPGAIHAALAAHEHTGDRRWLDLAADAVETLWAGLEPPDARGLRAWTQALLGSRRRIIGLVHGFAGNAHALLRAGELLGEERRRVLVDTAARLLEATAVRDGGGANWPADLDGGEAPSRLQVCHGAPGIVIAFSAIPPSENAKLDELLLAAGEATWRAGPIRRGPGLCHGTTGNGYALLALWARTGEHCWLERSRAFTMHALSQCERERATVGHGRHSLWTGDLILPFYVDACARGAPAVAGLDLL